MVQFPTNQANRSDSIRILTAAAEEERRRARKRRGEGLLLLYSKVGRSSLPEHRIAAVNPTPGWGSKVRILLLFFFFIYPDGSYFFRDHVTQRMQICAPSSLILFLFFFWFCRLHTFLTADRPTTRPGDMDGLGAGCIIITSLAFRLSSFPPHVLVPETLSTGDPEVPGRARSSPNRHGSPQELLRQRLLGDERPQFTGPNDVKIVVVVVDM